MLSFISNIMLISLIIIKNATTKKMKTRMSGTKGPNLWQISYEKQLCSSKTPQSQKTNKLIFENKLQVFSYNLFVFCFLNIFYQGLDPSSIQRFV